MYRLKVDWKQRRWRFVPQLLIAVLIAITLVVGNYQISEATPHTPQINTTNCKKLGNLVDYLPIVAGNKKIGALELYYNSSTGYNCAYTRAGGDSWGVAKVMEVYLYLCNEEQSREHCFPKKTDKDSGTFKYYAGPVGLYAKGVCVHAVGIITWEGRNYIASTGPLSVYLAPTHCGR